jgi:hypothetical protein
MTTPTAGLLMGFVGMGVLGLAACASPTSATPTAESTSSAGAAAGGEAAGGEAPAVLYSDARYHYRIEAPGHMTANTDGSATFIGPSERLEIVVVRGPQASDPTAMATKDQGTLMGTLTAFRKLSGPAAITLGGKKVIKFAYSWTAGTNSVTGKPLQLTSVRYYFAKDATEVAVVTYGIVTNQYDPEGADDLARTFLWQ